MKTKRMIRITAGPLLLGSFLLAGCSKEVGGDPAPGDLSIRLSAGLQATVQGGTKAVATGDAFTAAVGGWESTEAADYATAKTWLSTVGVTASESASEVTLSPARYLLQPERRSTHLYEGVVSPGDAQ